MLKFKVTIDGCDCYGRMCIHTIIVEGWDREDALTQGMAYGHVMKIEEVWD